MGFLATLSQWFSGSDDGEELAAEDTIAVSDGVSSDVAVGTQCLVKVTDRLFMVEITEVYDDAMRVTFPGYDYPIEGMILDLDFHDTDGIASYQAKVLEGPKKIGDGILLQKPVESRRMQHRDTARVPVRLDTKMAVKDSSEKHDAVIRNVSTTGAMIESLHLFERGALTDVSFEVPGVEAGEVSLVAEIMFVSKPEHTEAGDRYTYGTRFEGYAPGSGWAVTQYVWARLKELYPSV